MYNIKIRNIFTYFYKRTAYEKDYYDRRRNRRSRNTKPCSYAGIERSGYEIEYIGSYNGIEKGLIEANNIPYHGINSGKLRRYLDLKNLSDLFRVIHGYTQALGLMRKIKPDIVFSKGGFVSVPVVLAAKTCGVPAHQSVGNYSMEIAGRPMNYVVFLRLQSLFFSLLEVD